MTGEQGDVRLGQGCALDRRESRTQQAKRREAWQQRCGRSAHIPHQPLAVRGLLGLQGQRQARIELIGDAPHAAEQRITEARHSRAGRRTG